MVIARRPAWQISNGSSSLPTTASNDVIYYIMEMPLAEFDHGQPGSCEDALIITFMGPGSQKQFRSFAEALLIKILLFFDHLSIQLFQSNQRLQAIEFVDGPVPESSTCCRSRLEIYPQFPRSPLGTPGTMTTPFGGHT